MRPADLSWINRNKSAGLMLAGDESSSPHSLMEEMMGNDIRLTRAVKLAEKAFDKALRKHLQAEEVDWVFQNISWHTVDRLCYKETFVNINGRLRGYQEHVSGYVLVEPPFLDIVEALGENADIKDQPKELKVSRVILYQGASPRMCYYGTEL